MTETTDAMWKESVKRDRERRRRTNRAAWFTFYSRLADNHAGMAREFERRAEALLEDEPKGASR